MLLSQHNSIGMLLVQALGGGKASPGAPNMKDPNRVDVTAGAQSVEDAVAMMNRMLSIG